MMVKYGWWDVRGGNWCQMEMNTCPAALLKLQQLKLPKSIPNQSKTELKSTPNTPSKEIVTAETKSDQYTGSKKSQPF